MTISPETLIAERYKLVECLGAGGMGEVWKAQDTNFTRDVVVAVKLLKEDQTFAEDARNRGNFARLVQKEAAAGHLTFELVVNLLDESFSAGLQRDALRSAAESRLLGKEITPESAVALFDDLVNDSTFNENARHRKRLRDLFATEANSVAILQHPNLVRVTDYGDHVGVPFLVMDFINGRTLQQVVQRREPMPVARKLRLMEDLCEGLAYAHSKDLIHRDIKPANLIIDADTQRLKILDFGVVRSLQFNAQRSVSMGVPIGTYCYMSPEQARASRTLDNRSDIFSTGLVFYELLGFQRAFPSAGDVGELIGRIQRELPPPLRDLVPDLDPTIEAIVYKAIEKVPAKRYQDLVEMQRDIEGVRRRIEEDERRLARSSEASTFIVKPKPLRQQITDLVDRANQALETADYQAAIEFCDQILSLSAEQPDALEIKETARARLQAKYVDAMIADARKFLEGGDLSRAGQVLERGEIDPRDPVVRTFIGDLEAARRARRVESLLLDARTFLSTGAPDNALERAEAALSLDPENSDALRLASRARTQQQQLRKQTVDAAMAEAEAAVVAGRLDDAIRILTTVAGDPAADTMLAALLPKRDEQLAREQSIADALARARTLMDEGEFERAHQIVVQATSLDRKNADLAALRRRLDPIVRSLAQLDDAIGLFDQDAAEEAEAHLRGAAEALNPLRDQCPPVAARLNDVEVARAAAIERENARKRREALAAAERERRVILAERERMARALETAAQRVRVGLAHEQFDTAERELAELAGLPNSEDMAAELRHELEVSRRSALDASATRLRDAARQLAAAGDLEAALAKLREFSPSHPIVDAEIATVERAIRTREEDRARAAEIERARQKAERARLEVEERVDRVIADADARFAAGEFTEAVALLVNFTPSHPRVEDHIAALRKEHGRLEEAERAAAERARLNAERERVEGERRQLLAQAKDAWGERDYRTALALVTDLLALEAANVDASRLRMQIVADLRTAARRERGNIAFQELLKRYDPDFRRRRLMSQLAAGAAVVVVAGVAWLVADQWSLFDADEQNVTDFPVPTVTPTPPTTVQPTPAPAPIPPPPPQMASLIVDLRPWARVRITRTKGEGSVPTDALVTPFIINLAPGEYTLRAENDGMTTPLQITVRLESGQQRTVSQNMPGFNPDRVIDALLGQER